MEVINLYKISKEECSQDDVVFIGRNPDYYSKKFSFKRSIPELANQYKVGVDGEKGECVNLYHKWLMAKIKAKDQTIISAILTLKETDKLACFCSPSSCHGEIIIKAWQYLKGVGNESI